MSFTRHSIRALSRRLSGTVRPEILRGAPAHRAHHPPVRDWTSRLQGSRNRPVEIAATHSLVVAQRLIFAADDLAFERPVTENSRSRREPSGRPATPFGCEAIVV
jgi:hypothetical protein